MLWWNAFGYERCLDYDDVGNGLGSVTRTHWWEAFSARTSEASEMVESTLEWISDNASLLWPYWLLLPNQLPSFSWLGVTIDYSGVSLDILLQQGNGR